MFSFNHCLWFLIPTPVGTFLGGNIVFRKIWNIIFIIFIFFFYYLVFVFCSPRHAFAEYNYVLAISRFDIFWLVHMFSQMNYSFTRNTLIAMHLSFFYLHVTSIVFFASHTMEIYISALKYGSQATINSNFTIIRM